MEEQINLELSNLQEELMLLDAAVKQINKAGAISQGVIDAINSVQENYGRHLQKITDKYEEYLEQALKNADGKIDELSERHKVHLAEMQKLMNSYMELAEATARLPEEISQIDFPIRLDRIDSTTGEINQGILNTQRLIDSMERRFKSDYRRVGDLEKSIKTQGKQITTVQVLVIISFLMILGMLVLQLLPKFVK